MLKKTVQYGLCLFCCLLLGTVLACGKKGDPLPQRIDQLFSWRNVFVTLTPEGGLSVAGSVSGAVRNVQSMKLEVEPLDDACPTCPFIPLEIFPVSLNEAWEGSGPSFSFTVFPVTKASAYRWRLVGQNVVPSLPEVLSPVRITSQDNNLIEQGK